MKAEFPHITGFRTAGRALFALTMALLAYGRANAAEEVQDGLTAIEERWVQIQYEMKDDHERLAAARAAAAQARALMEAHPESVAAKVWYAKILLLEPEYRQSMGSLSVVREAKQLLEEAERADPKVLDGRVYTELGTLYEEVPGWPIAFGNRKKAAMLFEQALAVDPNNMEANYLYADFLARHGQPKEALTYYERALAAPDRPGHERADHYRRKEAQQDFTALRAKLRSMGKVS